MAKLVDEMQAELMELLTQFTDLVNAVKIYNIGVKHGKNIILYHIDSAELLSASYKFVKKFEEGK